MRYPILHRDLLPICYILSYPNSIIWHIFLTSVSLSFRLVCSSITLSLNPSLSDFSRWLSSWVDFNLSSIWAQRSFITLFYDPGSVVKNNRQKQWINILHFLWLFCYKSKLIMSKYQKINWPGRFIGLILLWITNFVYTSACRLSSLAELMDLLKLLSSISSLKERSSVRKVCSKATA